MQAEMNQEHIDAYRINYNVDDWRKHTENGKNNCLPFAAAIAVNALCDEVERLRMIVESKGME